MGFSKLAAFSLAHHVRPTQTPVDHIKPHEPLDSRLLQTAGTKSLLPKNNFTSLPSFISPTDPPRSPS
jgi:hypothetical protein